MNYFKGCNIVVCKLYLKTSRKSFIVETEAMIEDKSILFDQVSNEFSEVPGLLYLLACSYTTVWIPLIENLGLQSYSKLLPCTHLECTWERD